MDVSDLDIGSSIHIGDINLPEGIKTNQEEHLAVAVVVAPTVTAEEEVEEAEMEEEAAEAEGADAETQSLKEE